MKSGPLQLKASFYTITALQFYDFEVKQIEKQLKSWLKNTPHLFKGLPVVMDLTLLENIPDFNLVEIRQCLFRYGLIPIGIQGGKEFYQATAEKLQLPVFPESKKTAAQFSEDSLNHVTSPTDTKVITNPVRSGQQVYSKGDLVVLNTVSKGAELLAEGHIHVYGKLSGRALAGVSDNKNAYIFCRNIEAELVAIAGHYWLYEDLQRKSIKSNIYLRLQDNQLQMNTF